VVCICQQQGTTLYHTLFSQLNDAVNPVIGVSAAPGIDGRGDNRPFWGWQRGRRKR